MPRPGRPAWQPTRKDRELVKAMTAYGISQNEICAVLKVTRPTLEKRCRDELDSGAAEANTKVAASMLHMALKAPYATRFLACRYWLATRAGWHDADKVTIVQVAKAGFEMSDDEIDDVIAREMAYQQACEKAAADGTTVVRFPYTPTSPRRKR